MLSEKENLGTCSRRRHRSRARLCPPQAEPPDRVAPGQTAAADTPRHGKQSGRTAWTNRGWRRAHGPAQPVAVGVASDGPLGLSGARSLLCNTEQIKTPASPKPQSFRKEQRDGTRESLCDCGTRDRCEDVTPSAPRRSLCGPRSTSHLTPHTAEDVTPLCAPTLCGPHSTTRRRGSLSLPEPEIRHKTCIQGTHK